MEINKGSIKEILLSGGQITFPFVSKIKHISFEEISIYIDINTKLININKYGLKFEIGEIDDAIEEYCEIISGKGNLVFLFMEACDNLKLPYNFFDYNPESDEDYELYHNRIEEEIERIKKL